MFWHTQSPSGVVCASMIGQGDSRVDDMPAVGPVMNAIVLSELAQNLARNGIQCSLEFWASHSRAQSQSVRDIQKALTEVPLMYWRFFMAIDEIKKVFCFSGDNLSKRGDGQPPAQSWILQLHLAQLVR